REQNSGSICPAVVACKCLQAMEFAFERLLRLMTPTRTSFVGAIEANSNRMEGFRLDLCWCNCRRQPSLFVEQGRCALDRSSLSVRLSCYQCKRKLDSGFFSYLDHGAGSRRSLVEMARGGGLLRLLHHVLQLCLRNHGALSTRTLGALRGQHSFQ